jgi:hypothetical protein
MSDRFSRLILSGGSVMMLMDWLSALRTPKARRRRKQHIPVIAEVLEDRAAPSESLVSILGGGFLLGGLA